MIDIASLQKNLEKESDQKTKNWFENYLRGAIKYRGVKSPLVKKIVTAWMSQQKLNDLEINAVLNTAYRLLEQDYAEDKFAGIFIVQSQLKREEVNQPILILEIVEQAFKEGLVFDWSTSDWLCMRVTSPLLLKSKKNIAKRVADWRSEKSLWQRRSSIVSFLGCANELLFVDLIKRNVNSLVKEEERFIQTGIGWVISTMSKKHPELADELVKKHFESLSTEVIDRHTKYLKDHKKYKIMKRK